jgi:hypothetical protein
MDAKLSSGETRRELPCAALHRRAKGDDSNDCFTNIFHFTLFSIANLSVIHRCGQ